MDIRKFFSTSSSSKRRHSSTSTDESVEQGCAASPAEGDFGTCDYHHNDIGNWVNARSAMASSQKRELLTNCWVPPLHYDFSADAEHLKRKFNHNWLEMYKPWMVYSSKLKGAFCLYCVLFKPQKVRGIVSSFVIRPFVKYKNIHEYSRSHAASNTHKEATQSANLFLHQRPVDVQMQSGHEKIVAENRTYLKSILSAVIFCGTHDLPLRGKLNNEGIFHDLLMMRIEAGDECLKAMMEGNKNATYTSPRIQNELLEICSNVLKSYICKDIREATAYSILADETADMAGKEQLSIGIRFFDQRKMLIREELIGFVEIKSMKAEVIADSIRQFIFALNFDPQKCVGLGFDGCATMAGKINGVQTILKSSFPKSLYFHCASHKLNLVINDLNKVAEIRNTISTIKDIIVFFKESAIRRQYVPNIHSFCETRWSEKYASINDFKTNFLEIVKALNKLSVEGNSATRKHAYQLHSASCKPIFLICLCIISKYYLIVEPVANIMQSKTNDIIKCAEHITQILELVQAHRLTADIVFDGLFKDASELAERVSIEMNMPRVVEIQKNRPNVPFTSISNYYKRAVFIPYLDSLISSLSERFSEQNNPAFSLTTLHPNILKNMSLEDIKSKLLDAKALYKLDGIDNELELWYVACQKLDSTDLVCAFEKTELFPKIREAFGILLAMPCTTATVERSFSTLRRVKTWLRTTMAESRLNGLCMLSVHRKLVAENNTELKDRILDEFSKNPRKILII